MCAVLLVGVMGALAPAATAGGPRFPVPSCGWVSAGAIGRAVGEPVRELKPVWATQIAPVLSCQYVERTPKLRLGGGDLLQIQFREQQLLKPPAGAISVRGLGSCVAGRTCPKAGQPAWLFQLNSYGVAGNSPYAVKFVQLAALEVEDGFNQITVIVDNPNGPLPVANEARELEQLVRPLLPRFHWQ